MTSFALEPLVLQEALEQGEDDERPRVADVDAAVDRRPAGVDADLAGIARLELAGLAAEGVLDANARARRGCYWRARIAHIPPTGNHRQKVVSGNTRSGRYPDAALTEALALRSSAYTRWRTAFASLPERYLGADPGFHASYRIELDDLGLSWAVELTRTAARSPSPRARARTSSSEPTPPPGSSSARASSPGSTPSALGGSGRGGTSTSPSPSRVSSRLPQRPSAAASHPRGAGRQGADLHADRRRRDRDRDPDPRPGQQQDELLRDRLGPHPRSTPSTRSTCPASAPPRSRCARPTTRPGSRASVVRFMDALGIEPRPPGRQLAGRPGGDRGRPARAPERVQSLSLLCPSMAWRRRRHFVPVVRLLRPELAAIPHSFGGGWCASSSGACSRGPSGSTPPPPTSPSRSSCGPTARRPPGSPSTPPPATSTSRSRMARTGFWTRLRELEPPAMFVWGDEDPLVVRSPSRAMCSDALPDARQVVLEQCGHVPQVEHPVDANALVHDFIGHAPSLGRASARPGGSAAPPVACRAGSTATAVRTGTQPAARIHRRSPSTQRTLPTWPVYTT